MLTHGSLFAGIGGFDLGFERAGIETIWMVENDKNCNRVLEAHWPDVKRYEDVREVGRHNLQPVDIISGGFPCQDLSVAGRGAGLAGERSGLWWEFHRVIQELRPLRVIVENVPGLFAANQGEDFMVLIKAFAECGYGVAWRVLDSQHFGVAQRRRRVFIVGSLGDGSAIKVLFESEGSERDIAEGRETWQRIAAPIKASSPSSRRGGSNPIAEEFVVAPLQGRDSKGTSTTVDNKLIVGALDTRQGGVDDNEAQASHLIFQQNQRDEVREMDIVGAITAEPGVKQQNFVAFDWQSGGDVWLNISDKRTSALSRGQTPAVARTLSSTNPSEGGPGDRLPIAADRWGVRRFTPMEFERLQGFPDRFTEMLSDTQRYKTLGNAVTVNVTEWIGKRIVYDLDEG